MAAAAPAAAPYQPPAPTPYQPVASAPYQQTYQQPGQYQAAPPQKSGGVLKVILIIVAVFVLLGILGAGIFAFSVWRLSRAVHIEGNGKDGQVSLRTSGGTFTANSEKSYSAAELGTDIYPGAITGKGSMKMDLPTGSMVTGIFLTTDSKDKVVDFYKSRFGSEASTYETSDGAVLTMKKSEQEVVIVTVTAKSNENDGKTQIAIVHTKSTKS